MAKESFLRGAFILALASFISRFMGLLYMVMLPRIIKEEGMGLLQLVKPIYYLAAVLAIGGMPVAIAKLVAEKKALGSYSGVRRILLLSLLLLFFLGSAASLSMLLSARSFTEYIANDAGVYRIVLVLTPAPLFLALSGAFRGFFQGLQNMTPTATAQLVDQFVRVSVTLGFAYYLLPYGIEVAVLGAAFGTVLGECIGLASLGLSYLLLRKRIFSKEAVGNKKDPEGTLALVRRMMKLAFPVVISTILWPLMQMTDTLLIPRKLQALQFTGAEIRDATGYLGMALTLSQLPNIVTVALATSLIPAISHAYTLKSQIQIRHRTEEALRITLIFGIPAFFGLFVLATPICSLLFSYEEVAPLLQVLALGTLTLGLIQASTGILQGLGLVMVPVWNLTLALLIKASTNYLWINEKWGVLGAALGTTLAFGIAALLNLLALKRAVRFLTPWFLLVKIIFSASLMAALSFFVYQGIQSLPFSHPSLITEAYSLGIAMILGGLYYLFALIFLKVITLRDVNLVPRLGAPITRLLRFLKVFAP